MTYKDNTPTYNVNRKVVNFGDFCKTCEEPKLKKMKNQTTPNSERQNLPGNFKAKFNPVTRKIDNLSPAEVDDRLNKMNVEEVDESKVNESHIDDMIYSLVSKSECYAELERKFREAKEEFFSKVGEEVPEFDEGDTDHTMAVEALVMEATGEYGGYGY